MNDGLGKQAEDKIRQWLDRPEEGYCFDRIVDQMNGFFGSCNICDFTLYNKPYLYYIESKATWEDRFDFSRLTDYQYTHMLEKSKVDGVFAVVIVLFASYRRAFMISIKAIEYAKDRGIKSLNIKKIDNWEIPYQEIKTIPNSRKKLLDYDPNDNVL